MAIKPEPKTFEERAGRSYVRTAQALSSGEHGMEMLAKHIPYALGHNPNKQATWRRRAVPPEGKIIELEKFEDYLLRPAREGFGLPSLYFVDGSMKLLGKKGQPALVALREEIPDWDERVERERMARMDAAETKQGGDRKSEKYKSNTESVFDSQPSRAAANGVHRDTQRKLDRLAKDRPDLLAKVKAGELSVHAAAIEAGIVKSPSNLEAIKRLWGKLNRDERMDFWRWAHEQ